MRRRAAPDAEERIVSPRRLLKRRKGSLEELRDQIVVCSDDDGDEDRVRWSKSPTVIDRRAQAGLSETLRSRGFLITPSIDAGDYVDVVPWAHVPECGWFDGCSRLIGSGPRHAKFERQLRHQLNIADDERLDFRLVARESDESRDHLGRFRAYVASLPEGHRQVWKMWHGIRGSQSYNTDDSRVDQLDPARVVPNAQRPVFKRNRLGDGLYFASHLAYNTRGGFFDVARDTGAVKVLQCLVAPGRYLHLGRGGAPDMALPPPGFDSRVAHGFSGSGVVIACVHERDAVFVEHEVHIYGLWSCAP